MNPYSTRREDLIAISGEIPAAVIMTRVIPCNELVLDREVGFLRRRVLALCLKNLPSACGFFVIKPIMIPTSEMIRCCVISLVHVLQVHRVSPIKPT